MTCTLPEKTLTLWRIRTAAALGTAITANALLSLFFYPFIAVAAVFFVLLLWLETRYLPRFFKGYTVTANETVITVEYGVFFRFVRVIPYPRLVFGSLLSTPLSKRFGLCAVTLKAARGLIIVAEMEESDAKFLLCGISGGSIK